MRPGLGIGAKQVTTFTVDERRTIAFMGDALRAYSTPSMVLDVEHACRDLLVAFHEPGEDSVGARVEIDHLGPTLLGQSVTVTATVAAVDLPRVTFDIDVRDDIDTVGAARHVRFVVDTVKQGERLEKKAARVAAASAASQRESAA